MKTSILIIAVIVLTASAFETEITKSKFGKTPILSETLVQDSFSHSATFKVEFLLSS